MIKRLSFAAALVLVSSAVDAATIKHDHYAGADFSGYSTFAWKDDSRDTPNPLAARRISEALEKAFGERGFEMSTAEEADFLIDFDATLTQALRIDETWWGVRPRRRGGWVRELDVTTYPVGTLAVVVIDGTDQEVVWRGVVEGAVVENRDKMLKKIDKALKKLLKQFPPS